ncbi:MAG: Holliday junction resolvase RuvX [Acidobacteria bacterium]|nr:Holliday junction resolvase RuvX [Acidobacteriota bacterium]
MTGRSVEYDGIVRVLGIDLGEKRVGLAMSDHSRTLATPLKTLQVGGDVVAIVDALRREIAELSGQEDGLALIVIGWPRHLDGTEHARAAWTRSVAKRLADAVDLPVLFQDERLTSHEADERLAVRERNWRRRKQKLDAAAAAIMLQDFLDARKNSEAEP